MADIADIEEARTWRLVHEQTTEDRARAETALARLEENPFGYFKPKSFDLMDVVNSFIPIIYSDQPDFVESDERSVFAVGPWVNLVQRERIRVELEGDLAFIGT